MTSKEYIEEHLNQLKKDFDIAIKENLKDYANKLVEDINKSEAIKKELEKLELLQDFINNFLDFKLVYDDVDWYEIIPLPQYLSTCGCRILTEEKYKKIKEALEK